MPKTKEQKAKELEGMGDRIGRMVGAVVADFTRVKVQELEELRRNARVEDCEYLVVKKTLFTRAAKERGMHIVPERFSGSMSVLFGFSDPVAAAKIAKTFAKTHEAMQILGGFICEDGQVRDLNAAEVLQLGDLPSREVLIARAVGSIAAPLRGLVGVLQGNLRGLVGVLSAIKDAKA